SSDWPRRAPPARAATGASERVPQVHGRRRVPAAGDVAEHVEAAAQADREVARQEVVVDAAAPAEREAGAVPREAARVQQVARQASGAPAAFREERPPHE